MGMIGILKVVMVYFAQDIKTFYYSVRKRGCGMESEGVTLKKLEKH